MFETIFFGQWDTASKNHCRDSTTKWTGGTQALPYFKYGVCFSFQGHLPTNTWGKCILTVGYLINKTPSSLLKAKMPYELLHGKMLSYSHIRSFGCLAYVHDHDLPRDKFRARSRVCIFLGYPFNKKGCRFYDLDKRKIIYSRDIVFDETKFPYAYMVINSQDSSLEFATFATLFNFGENILGSQNLDL